MGMWGQDRRQGRRQGRRRGRRRPDRHWEDNTDPGGTEEEEGRTTSQCRDSGYRGSDRTD